MQDTFNASLIFRGTEPDDIHLVVTVVVAHTDPIEREKVRELITAGLNAVSEQKLQIRLATVGGMIAKSIKRQLGYEAVCIVTDELLPVVVRASGAQMQ